MQLLRGPHVRPRGLPRRLLSYMRENDITLAGDALQINYIDDNITDCDNEFLYEIQIPVAPR